MVLENAILAISTGGKHEKNCYWILSCVCLCHAISANVSSLLDAAKEEYSSGNLNGAIQKINEAKKIIESESLSKTKNTYMEVKNWEEIDLKANFYSGKKVKIRGTYYGTSATGRISIDFRNCSYEQSLVDKILKLQTSKPYTFYGTVVLGGFRPYIHVENIEI